MTESVKDFPVKENQVVKDNRDKRAGIAMAMRLTLVLELFLKPRQPLFLWPSLWAGSLSLRNVPVNDETLNGIRRFQKRFRTSWQHLRQQLWWQKMTGRSAWR
jgi:hypothetical protein